jgi:hypothetical protein
LNKNLDIITCAVSWIIKAAIVAGRFLGRARKRSLQKKNLRIIAMFCPSETVFFVSLQNMETVVVTRN